MEMMNKKTFELKQRDNPVYDSDDHEITCFMTITNEAVYQWGLETGWTQLEGKSFKHGLGKLPIIYTYRPEVYCKKIETFRVRLEKLLSNYADCIDYYFFPILRSVGDVACRECGKIR